jgi:hypothetical protein
MVRVSMALALTVLMAAAGYATTATAAGKKAQEAAKQAPAEREEAAGEQTEAKRKPADPAEAQKILAAAEKSLEAGKSDQAIQQLNALLSGARLQPRLMAQALYLRGTAHHKQGRPAQAIADLTSALWLKGGFSDADRAMALAARSDAYRAAGLADLADADARKAGKKPSGAVATSRPEAAATSAAAREVTTATTANAAAEQKSSNSGGSLWSNLFGGGQSGTSASGSAKEPRRAASDTPTASPARQPSVGEAWSSTTTSATRADPAPVKEQIAIEPAAAKRAVATRPEGRYRLQVAAVRSRKEALQVAARLKKEQPALIGAREPEVDETVLGNMGVFYRVRIGPFADANEPQAFCPKLRGLGLDCLVIAD